MIAALLLALGFVLVFVSMGFYLSGPKYKGPLTDHFDGTKFFTPGGARAKGPGDLLQWMINRRRGPWSAQGKIVPQEKPPARVGRGARVTFVNHSTFLIQADGINFLTDPVWSDRTSPFQWAGPKRLHPPGIRFEDLPKIDVVLLSHNHYDHLDLMTMKQVFDQHRPMIVTSLGVKAFLDRHGITGSSDLDWWQKHVVSDAIEIQAVPAQHFSGRGTFDRDATLWCGYVIHRPGGNIYFVGDTGYHDQIFREIGERCAPIEIALVPIGAFKPQWFMSPIHCSPAEAVKIHHEIKAKQSIATHFGTFPLADDGEEEPVAELLAALDLQSISRDRFIVLRQGEGRNF